MVTGRVELTPIQRWFFSRDYAHAWHYNQSVMLQSEERLSAEGLGKVLQYLQDHHDALRMCYRLEGGQVVQESLPGGAVFSLEEHDFRGLSSEEEALEACASSLQAGAKLEEGGLFRGGLYHLSDGDRLLLVSHHLQVDTVSWRILLEDLETLYGQYQSGDLLSLPLKTDSYQSWSSAPRDALCA